MRRFVEDPFALALSRSSCLNCLHRLGLALKRPMKRLLKADPVRRDAFVGEYAALTIAAARTGAKIFSADEAIWGWARQEVTANLCLGTRAAVRENVGGYFTDLTHRHEEVKRRCRTVLQAKADEPIGDAHANPVRPPNVDFTLASV